MRIGFIGLGKLGMPVASKMQEYHEVFGYDSNPNVWRQNADENISKCYNIADAITNKDFVFIAVPTPHDPEYGGEKPTSHLEPKDFSYDALESVLSEAESIYQHHEGSPVFVVISTVLPGTIRRLQRKYTAIKILYNPYLIAMGTVEEDFMNPEMVIIGSYDLEDPEVEDLKKFYNSILHNPTIPNKHSTRSETNFVCGTYEDAECIKVFYNTFITAKITLANTVMDAANSVGADAYRVMGAIRSGTDRIVSTRYLKPGMGDGGPCHPRDNIALSWFAKQHGLPYDMFGTLMQIREKQAEHMADYLVGLARTQSQVPNTPIIINGTSFKPGVDLQDGSYSKLVGYYCEQKGYRVHYVDKGDYHITFEYGVVLMAHSTLSFYAKYGKYCVIVDPWGQLQSDTNRVIHYGRQ